MNRYNKPLSVQAVLDRLPLQTTKPTTPQNSDTIALKSYLATLLPAHLFFHLQRNGDKLVIKVMRAGERMLLLSKVNQLLASCQKKDASIKFIEIIVCPKF